MRPDATLQLPLSSRNTRRWPPDPGNWPALLGPRVQAMEMPPGDRPPRGPSPPIEFPFLLRSSGGTKRPHQRPPSSHPEHAGGDVHASARREECGEPGTTGARQPGRRRPAPSHIFGGHRDAPGNMLDDDDPAFWDARELPLLAQWWAGVHPEKVGAPR